MKCPLFSLLAAACLMPAAFAVTVDGSKAGDDYGDALAVQTNGTEFGNNKSELNAAYAKIEGDTFFLMLTGNLENNFNKLDVFIDSRAAARM